MTFQSIINVTLNSFHLAVSAFQGLLVSDEPAQKMLEQVQHDVVTLYQGPLVLTSLGEQISALRASHSYFDKLSTDSFGRFVP